MFCAASVAPPAVADGDLPMLAFLSFPVSSLLMCAAAIRRTGFFVFHGIPNPAFSALPTLCFHHFLIIFDFSTSAVSPPGALPSGRAGNAGNKPSPGAWFAPFPSAARVQPPGTCMAWSVRAASGLMPGCRGRSPRRNKLWISPFPPGRGLGGWGQQSKLKAGLVGDKESTPPLGHRFGKPTTQGAEGHAPAKTPLHALKNPVILLTFAPPHGIIFTRIPRITCTNI